MRKTTLAILGLAVILAGAMVYYSDYGKQALGAFGDPFLSIQLATSPSNGNCLTTDGTNNAWGSCAGSSTGISDPFTHAFLGQSATSSILYTSGLLTGTSTIGNLLATSTVTFLNALGISSGGTNATRLSSALLWFDGTSIQATSSQVTVGSLVSTTTATSTFQGDILIAGTSHLATHGIIASESQGIHFHSNNGTEVAFFGAGGASTATFLGGVNIDGATRLATSLTGFLKATAGSVTTATIDLASDVTGTLPIVRGGTNATRLSNSLLWFNGTSIEATSSPVTVGSIIATTTATSTFNGGLSTTNIGATATSTLRGVQIQAGGLKLANISCDVLATNSAGDVICDTDANSGGTVTGTGINNTIATWNSTTGITATSALPLWVGAINATSSNTSVFTANPTFSGLTSALIITGSAGLTAEYAGTGCTNQVIEDLSVLGAATCVSINNGYWSGTQLSIANGGTNATSFPSNSLIAMNGTAFQATSTQPLWVGSIQATTTATSTFRGGINAYQGQFNNIEATSTVGTSTIAGGASIAKLSVTTFLDAASATIFRITQSASLALSTVAGALGIDTTSGQLRWHDGTNQHIALDEECKTFNMASSTGPVFDSDKPFGQATNATTTYSINTVNIASGMTLSSITCQTDSGVALLRINNAGASPTFSHLFCKAGLVAGQNASTSFSANNTFAQYSDARIQIGSATGTVPDVVYGTVCFRPTSN